MENSTIAASWSTGKRIAFRFFFIYFILYVFPFPLGWIPYTDFFMPNLNNLLKPLIDFTGRNILHLQYDNLVLPAGSGDTTYNYIQIFLFATIAVVGTVIWSVADRKSTDYEKLWRGLTIVIRYYLAVILLNYGFVKIIQNQFPFPLHRLSQPIGDLSPMGLLWTFMGYSPAYNFFTGLMEALGGFLLFFRRTRLLGALLSIAVMTNVVVLNFAYDVPVKLFSLHLLAMTIVLVLPDARRLINFFILNQRVEQERLQPIYSKQTRVVYFLGKTALILFILTAYISQGLQMQKRYYNYFDNPPLFGIYDVETFILNGDTLTDGMNVQRRWKKIDIAMKNGAIIEYMDGAKIFTGFRADTIKHTIKLDEARASVDHNFIYEPNDNGMLLKGFLYQQDSVIAVLKKKPFNKFLLVSRGFHWVNEYPLNN